MQISARRMTVQALITLLFFAMAGVAIIAGSRVLARQPPAPIAAAPMTPVAAMAVQIAPGYTVTRRFTGQIAAAARVDLAFELPGTLAEVLVREGDRVEAGQLLARLDTQALRPERAALEAQLEALAADAELARLTLGRNDALAERGFRSVAAQDEARLSLARAEAGMAALRAQIAGVDVRLAKSALSAPFAARVGARLADPGQAVAAGSPVLELFDDAPQEVRVGLPPALAATLAPGDAVQLEVAEARLAGKVLRIRPDLDPVTRSQVVVVSLPPQAPGALGTTAGVLLVQEVAERGFWAPLSALDEGARGSWTVMTLEPTTEGDVIRAAAVEVIHTEGARVFLRGALPPGARIVAEAPDRVVPGQLVLARAR